MIIIPHTSQPLFSPSKQKCQDDTFIFIFETFAVMMSVIKKGCIWVNPIAPRLAKTQGSQSECSRFKDQCCLPCMQITLHIRWVLVERWRGSQNFKAPSDFCLESMDVCVGWCMPAMYSHLLIAFRTFHFSFQGCLASLWFLSFLFQMFLC